MRRRSRQSPLGAISIFKRPLLFVLEYRQVPFQFSEMGRNKYAPGPAIHARLLLIQLESIRMRPFAGVV